MQTDDSPDLPATIRAEQIRLHDQVLPLTLAGSAALALIMLMMLGTEVDRPWLLAWLGALGLSLLGRWTVRMLQRRAGGKLAADRRWLRLHQAAFALHGVVWGLGGALFLLQAAPEHRDLIVLALVALIAGCMINASFDLAAAGLFSTPAAAPLLLPLLVPRTGSMPASVLVAMLLLGIVTMAMLRVHRTLVATVAGRFDQARRSEATLRSAELLDRTGALAQVGAWELDVPTRSLRLSQQSRHLLDLATGADTASLELVLDCCAADGRRQLEAALDRAVKDRVPFGLELAMSTARGRAITVRMSGHPQVEPIQEPGRAQGRPQGQPHERVVRIDGAMQDVSELRAVDRALADKQELLEQLLRSTSQGFWFVDNQGLTTDLNPAMCALLGRTRAEVLGQPAQAFFGGADLAVIEQQFTARCRGEHSGYEIGITRPDGSRVHCFNNATPIVDASGERVGSVGIWTDLSTRQAAESARRIYETVTNSTADLISVVDENEVYLMVNDAWCQGFGVERKLALGRTPMEVLPESVQPERRRAIRAAIEQQLTSVVRSPVQMAGAGVRHMESTYYPFADDGSGGRRIVIISRDVTRAEHDRAALQASAAAQRTLLDAFPGMIAVTDGENRYSYINLRLANLFARDPSAIVGRPLAEVHEASRCAEISEAVAHARRGGRVSSTMHFPATATRAAVDLEVDHIAGLRQPDGSQPVFSFGLDVTERKRMQAALVIALEQAERANASKSMFLSSMSHELRTPMNAILGFGQLLESDPDDPLSARQRTFVREILRGGQHLLALINDLLDLGSIEAGELRTACQLLPLGPLIDDCIALVRPLAQVRAIEIDGTQASLRALPPAWADPKRLRQVLLNLLSNAIKYNRAGGRVEVTVVEAGSRLEIGVNDTGPGLSSAQQQRLFKPFERLDAQHGNVEGTGIGLALSRRLVEAMGGEIGVDSTPGRGSRFRVRLRRSDPSSTAAAMTPWPLFADPAAGPGRVRPSALYIDDNPVNLRLMEAALQGVVQLECELDALAGLERARSLQPDIVLLDLQLPGIDGLGVLQRLRAEPLTRHIPVLAVSANVLPAAAAAGQAAGFAAYLTKPLDIELLKSTLRRLLGEPASPSRRQPPDAEGRPSGLGRP